jgi:2,3-dihydroxybenzoate-AMP ligase
MSFADLLAEVQQLAGKLRALGIGRGEIIILQQRNQRDLPLSLMACLWAGCVPLLALPGHGSHEVNSWLQQTGARVLWRDTPLKNILFPADGLVLGGPTCPLLNIQAPPMHQPDPQDPEGLALLLVSGGSTGTPKLIPRSHNDYLCCLRLSSQRCGIEARHRYLCLLPGAHNFALASPGILGFWQAGACVVLSDEAMPKAQIQLLERFKITQTALVPAQALAWLNSCGKEPALAGITQGVQLQVGGAPLDAATALALENQLGVGLQQVFGMAEGLLHYTDASDSQALRTGTQGRPLCPLDEICLLGLDGMPVAPGEAGELCTQGPYTLRAYYPNHLNPDAQAQAAASFTAGGWYRSGDWVRQLPSGHIQVLGRIKDQINRGGEKIDCAEVEGLLRQHPAVLDAALIGLDDPYMGELACACISLKAPFVPLASLADYLLKLGLARYKIPARWVGFEQLPQTAVGKVDKNALRRALPGHLTPTLNCF